MGHNLNFNENTGHYSFFSVQQKAWHGLGQIVSGYPTSEEAIKHAGLDYEVLKKPVVIKNVGLQDQQDGQPAEAIDIEIPERFGTYRSDTSQAFDVVGKDYQIVQNREAFSFFDAIVGGNDGILYETAGCT